MVDFTLLLSNFVERPCGTRNQRNLQNSTIISTPPCNSSAKTAMNWSKVTLKPPSARLSLRRKCDFMNKRKTKHWQQCYTVIADFELQKKTCNWTVIIFQQQSFDLPKKARWQIIDEFELLFSGSVCRPSNHSRELADKIRKLISLKCFISAPISLRFMET